MNVNATLEKALAGRWIAGYYPEDAINRTKLFNSKKISTIINFLGENLIEAPEVRASVGIYRDLIKKISAERLDACISLKPTQIGLSLSYKLMLSNYLDIVRDARQRNIMVWLDMEDSQYVDATIKAYKSAAKLENTGICTQAYLRRSANDVENLIKLNARIRLVKGAYKVEKNLTFGSHRAVSHNYMQLAEMLLEGSDNFMLATHDTRIIENAIKMNRKYKRKVTYAMLNGIRNSYAKYLAYHGHRVAVYVPFGGEWISYGYRRLREQGHLTLILRSLFETQKI